MVKKRKSSKKKSKPKKKSFSQEEINFIRKMHDINLIYLDNALLGYKSDEEDKKKCGVDLLNWIKKINAKTLISFINIYELRPLFSGKIRKEHPHLSEDILKSLDEFNPDLISEKNTIKLAKENKKLWNYLTKTLKISEGDAAHFVIAVASESDLFVSFNKRAFQKNNKKISKKLIEFGYKLPNVWTLKDIKKNMAVYDTILKF